MYSCLLSSVDSNLFPLCCDDSAVLHLSHLNNKKQGAPILERHDVTTAANSRWLTKNKTGHIPEALRLLARINLIRLFQCERSPSQTCSWTSDWYGFSFYLIYENENITGLLLITLAYLPLLQLKRKGNLVPHSSSCPTFLHSSHTLRSQDKYQETPFMCDIFMLRNFRCGQFLYNSEKKVVSASLSIKKIQELHWELYSHIRSRGRHTIIRTLKCYTITILLMY